MVVNITKNDLFPGRFLYFVNFGGNILEEKPELTFNSNFRHFDNKGSGLWTARITFEPNKNEALHPKMKSLVISAYTRF